MIILSENSGGSVTVTMDQHTEIWECNLCQTLHKQSKRVFYYSQNDFKEHYDQTCHICSSEFTTRLLKEEHQAQHSAGISVEFKSLCSLCGKKFKVQ